MASTALYLRLMHTSQAALSIYAAMQSYQAITHLRTYEATSKKLAEWSDEAAHQLHKTRTTQTTGALATLASLLASLLLAVAGPSLASWTRFALSPALLMIVLFARGHIKNFWAPGEAKTVGVRVPLPKMGEYNEALRRTEELLVSLEYLEYSWVAASFVGGMLGYN